MLLLVCLSWNKCLKGAHCFKVMYIYIYYFSSPENTPLYEFLESCLRHKSELVIYEAARALVNLKSVKTKDLQPAVSGKY